MLDMYTLAMRHVVGHVCSVLSSVQRLGGGVLGGFLSSVDGGLAGVGAHFRASEEVRHLDLSREGTGLLRAQVNGYPCACRPCYARAVNLRGSPAPSG